MEIPAVPGHVWLKGSSGESLRISWRTTQAGLPDYFRGEFLAWLVNSDPDLLNELQARYLARRITLRIPRDRWDGIHEVPGITRRFAGELLGSPPFSPFDIFLGMESQGLVEPILNVRKIGRVHPLQNGFREKSAPQSTVVFGLLLNGSVPVENYSLALNFLGRTQFFPFSRGGVENLFFLVLKFDFFYASALLAIEPYGDDEIGRLYLTFAIKPNGAWD